MALLNSYGNANKVTDTALNVKYSVEMGTITKKEYPEGKGSTGGVQYVQTPYYRVTRYATKKYNYVGMDYATAVSCQNAKIAQYTRNYSRIVETLSSDPDWEAPWDDPDAQAPEVTVLSTETFYGCTSDIAATHKDGGMWNVSIQVNETDEKPATELPANVASLFAAENARNYDQGGE